jgi:hypothetical protein
MTDQPMQPIPRVESLFQHRPHPRLAELRQKKPPVTSDERVGLNGKIGLAITAIVGTMWAAYIFTVLALISFPAAIDSKNIITIISWVAQTFLQLVLLPIIIVGQNILGKASDKRAIETYKDAEAILTECLQLQAHLQAQDVVLDDVVAHVKKHHEELQRLSARVGPAPA